MDNARSDPTTPDAPNRPGFSVVRWMFDLALLWSFISAISIPLRIDNWPTAVFLSYPPRITYILFATGFAIYLLLTQVLLTRALPFRGLFSRIKRGYWIRLGMSLPLLKLSNCQHRRSPGRVRRPACENHSPRHYLLTRSIGKPPQSDRGELPQSSIVLRH